MEMDIFVAYFKMLSPDLPRPAVTNHVKLESG
jgi:hypothetical protein